MQKKFQAGNLDRKIRIIRKINTKDRSGQDITTWQLYHECSAHLAPFLGVAGNEKNQEMAIYAISHKTFLIRYKTGITPEMAVEYETQQYNIKSVNEPPDTRHQWLLIEAVLKL